MTFGEGCTAIRRWWRMVAPWGDLTIVIPDANKAVELFEAERIDYPMFSLVLNGERQPKEMHHKSAWSVASLWHILDSLDDASIELVDKDDRTVAEPPWQTIMRATKVYRV